MGAKGTGYVPPRKDVIDAENGLKDFVTEHPMFQAAANQMDGVVSWASFPGDAGLEAEQKLIDIGAGSDLKRRRGCGYDHAGDAGCDQSDHEIEKERTDESTSFRTDIGYTYS